MVEYILTALTKQKFVRNNSFLFPCSLSKKWYSQTALIKKDIRFTIQSSRNELFLILYTLTLLSITYPITGYMNIFTVNHLCFKLLFIPEVTKYSIIGTTPIDIAATANIYSEDFLSKEITSFLKKGNAIIKDIYAYKYHKCQ